MNKKLKLSGKKMLVSFLIVALLLTCSGYYELAVQASEAISNIDLNLNLDSQDEDTSSSTEENTPKIVKELPQERTEYSTVYLNDDGSKTAKFYSAPIRYKDDNNNLVDIDSSLIALESNEKSIGESTYEYTSKATEVKTYFPSALSKENPILVSFEEYSVSLMPIENTLSECKSEADCVVSTKNVASIKKEETLDLYTDKTVEKDNKIKYSGTKDSKDSNVDIEYISTNNGLKENIIINSQTDNNTFSFWLEIKNAYPELTEYGAILFKDIKTDEEIGAIPAPYMSDSSEDTAYSTDVSYELTEAQGGYIVTVVANKEYLNSKDRVYPIIIDPSITLEGNSEVMDVYIKSGYPTTNFYSSDTRLMPVGYGAERISRTLVKFPTLSSTISGKVITSAGFHAKEHDNSGGSNFCSVKLYRNTESWSVSSVTWNTRPDYSSFSTEIETNTGTAWHTWDVKKLVGWWANGTYSNYGLLMRATVEDISNYDDYYGSRTTATDYRPYLVVNYQSPSTLSTPTVTSGGVNSGYSNVSMTFTEVSGAAKYYLNITGVGGTTITRDITSECGTGTTRTWSSSGRTIFSGYTGFPNSSADPLGGTGSYSFTVKAANADGVGVNSNSKTVALSDNTAPNAVSSVTIGSITRNATDPSKANIAVSFPKTTDLTAENGSGIKEYRAGLYYTNASNQVVLSGSEKVIASSSASTFSCTFTAVDCDLNNPVVKVRAYDVNNNYSALRSSSTIVIPDYEKPSAPTVTINPLSWTSQTTIGVSWTGLTDNRSTGSGIQVFYRLATGSISNPAYLTTEQSLGTGESGTKNITVTNGNDGAILVIVYGKDQAGNVGSVGYSTYYRDTLDPVIEITSPENESSISNGSVSITGTISDSNLSSWTLSYKKDGFPWIGSYEQIASGTSAIVNSEIAIVDTSTFVVGAEYIFKFIATDAAGKQTTLYKHYFIVQNGISEVPIFQINPDPGYEWSIGTYDYIFTPIPESGYTLPTGEKALFIDGNYIDTYTSNEDIQTDLSNILSYPDGSAHNGVVRIVDSAGEEYYSSTVIKRDLFIYALQPQEELTTTGDAILSTNGANLDISQGTATSGSVETIEKTISGKIASIKLQSQADIPSNTSVTYYLSINGSDYFEVVNNTRIYMEEFTSQIENNATNNSVRVKIVMESADGTATPTVSSLEVYSTQFTNNSNSIFTVAIPSFGIKDYYSFTGFSTQSGSGYINPLSGNLIYTVSDLSIDSPTNSLGTERIYNSQNTYASIFGQGWDYKHNIMLVKVVDEYSQETGVLLKLGDGSVYRFTKNQDGTYTCPGGLYAALAFDSQSNTYTLVFADKTEYAFNTDNKIESITDRNGNALEFAYNAAGNISSITDNVSNAMSFTYCEETGKEGLIETITGSGKTYRYEYDANRTLQKAYIFYDNQQIGGEQYTYTNGMLSVIKNSNGDDYSIAYNSNAYKKVISVTDPLNQEMTFDYSVENNDLKLETSYQNAAEQYYYNSNSLVLKKSVDANSNEIEYTYDSDYNLTGIQYPNDITESYAYDSGGNVTSFTNKAGKDTDYIYADASNPDMATQISEPFNGTDKKVTNNTYDIYGNLSTTSVAQSNQVTAYTYDAFGNTLTEIDTITDGANTYTAETDYTYDNKGRLLSTTVIDNENSQNNIITSQTYDAYGNIDTSTDANGVVTKYYYNILGQMTQQTSAYNTVGEINAYYTYDALGNMQMQISAYETENAVSTYYTYDALGRELAVEYPDGTSMSTTYTVNEDGTQKTEQTDAEGNVTIAVTNKIGQTIISGTVGETGDNNENTIANGYTYDGDTLIVYTLTTYDAMGNVTQTLNNAGIKTASVYNDIGWVLSATVSDAEDTLTSQIAYTYDDAGNVLTEMASDITTTTTYDKLNRPLTVIEAKNGESSETTYAYNGVYNGKLYSVITDPNDRQTTYEYDSKGRLVNEVLGTKTTEYTYDDSGNMLTSTLTDSTLPSESAETIYTYDELSRKISTTYSVDDQYILYTYDDNNNITQERLYENDVLSSATEYAYDNMNRVIQVERDSEVIAIYTYTDGGNLESIKYGDDVTDKKIGYAYDEAGKIIEVRDQTNGTDALIREYFYEDGQLSYLEDARATEDAKQEFIYDELGRLTNVYYYDIDDVTVLEEYTITYNVNNQITQESTTTRYGETPITTTKAYEYDDLGRLASETVNGTDTTSYTYDAVGNRLTMTKGPDAYAYTYNNYDQLTEIKLNNVTQTTYTYDLSGNEITKTEGSVVTNYIYDDANWLQSVTQQTGQDPAVTISTYDYDANGQRTQKTVGSSETNYYYSGINLLYTKDASNDIIEENTLEPDGSMICSTKADSNDYWYRQDIRGSITNIVDVDDDVVKSYAYDAYGNTAETGTIVNSFAYTGAVIDEETDLYYMNARYYDPEMGRFISQDTYRGTGDVFWHLYLYCDSDPVNNIDKTGHTTYNRTNAIKYAHSWYWRKNPQYYGYIADCANFVSQCLHAGGIPMNKNWHSYRMDDCYYYYWDVTAAWRLATEQYKYFNNSKKHKQGSFYITSSGIKTAIKKGIKKGDLMYFDNEGDGVPNHATMISKVEPSMIKYTAHTKPRFDEKITTFFEKHSKKARVYIIKIKDSF